MLIFKEQFVILFSIAKKKTDIFVERITMKYCKKCGRLENDDLEKCSKCKNSPLVSGEPTNDFPVVLIRTSGFEKQRICSALDSENIPYSIRIAEKQLSADAITGVSHADYDVLTPYAFYRKAADILLGINALKDDSNVFDAEDKSAQADDDYYSPKNRIVRIISVILLLVIVAGVVLGVDFVMAAIKGFIFG